MDRELVQLPSSTIAFLYQSGVDHIRQGYEAAAEALQNAARDAEAASLDYASSGNDDSVYEFEDGQPVLISSTQHELDYAQIEVAYSVRAIREAFVISSFHYWEKWARSITKLNDPTKHTYEVVKKCFAKSHAIHQQLDQINRLTNILKHGSGAFRHARSLAKDRRDLFSHLPGLYGNWTISLSDENVREALVIVSGSGPK